MQLTFLNESAHIEQIRERAKELLQDMETHSAADLRVFLATNLPYYETEDEDNFFYLANAEDIERVAMELHRYLTT